MPTPPKKSRVHPAYYYSLAAGTLTLGSVPLAHAATWGDITYTTTGSNWMINNNSLQLTFNTTSQNITRLVVDGHSADNMLDSANSQIYNELAKSGLDVGTASSSSAAFVTGLAGSTHYLDVYTQQNSSSTRAFTYQIHYLLFEDDPAIHMYMVLNHSATDIAGSYGQGQFLFRSNTGIFTNTYQYHVSPNDPVSAYPHAATFPQPASTFGTVSGQAGRAVQDATTDLTGSSLQSQGDWGTPFMTKYDYSSYEQFDDAKVEFGTSSSTNTPYAISTIYPYKDTMTGGPTKQNLQYTNTSILMAEYLSGHYGTTPGYAYVPPQGVDTSRLFGPYVFGISANTSNETGTQLYQDALNKIPVYQNLYDQDATLVANGFTPRNQRGSLEAVVANAAGWSSNVNNNTLVLTDNQTNFQRASYGNQYWTQINSDGSANINNIVPGTYRISLYQLGQWGETRYDNVQINPGQISLPQNLQFTAENFSTNGNAPIWTLGTPDRSSHEFLNGHDANGLDIRQYQGSYDYWQEEQNLGTPGKVVYYATNVPGHAATNDTNKWIANQWKTFNPGLYDATNSTSDNYANIAPAYVRDPAHGGTGTGPASYSGSPWEIHFSPTAAQIAQGRYIELSVALAADEGSLTVVLNNGATTSTKVWHGHNASDPMTRSGDAGFYQWIVFQFDNVGGNLLTAGADDFFTFSPSQTQGVMYDALRMEISTVSADPSQSGWQWNDYDFINSNGSTNAANANEALGLIADVPFFIPEPVSALFVLGGIPLLLRRRR